MQALRFRSSGSDPDQSFEAWRQFISLMYDVRQLDGEEPPRGDATCFLVGDVLVNRTVFGAQRASRDRRLVSSTPDHVILQVWCTGGYAGEVAGKKIALSGGATAFADRRLELDVRMARSDTIGVALPRELLHGLDLEAVPTRLHDRVGAVLRREILPLYRCLHTCSQEHADDAVDRFLACVRRALDGSSSPDALDGPEFDSGVRARAEQIIRRELGGGGELDPDGLAGRLTVSRATIYRLFAAFGGVRRFIQAERLAAMRDMLSDDLDQRPISVLAETLGFSSAGLLSRQFREAFGCSPGEWRRHHVEEAEHRDPDHGGRINRSYETMRARSRVSSDARR